MSDTQRHWWQSPLPFRDTRERSVGTLFIGAPTVGTIVLLRAFMPEWGFVNVLVGLAVGLLALVGVEAWQRARTPDSH